METTLGKSSRHHSVNIGLDVLLWTPRIPWPDRSPFHIFLCFVAFLHSFPSSRIPNGKRCCLVVCTDL